MNQIICKRCGSEAPRSSSRNNKVHGGRICADCSSDVGKMMNRDTPSFFRKPPSTDFQRDAQKQFAQKKIGLINRIVNRLFRRRGIQ